MRIILRIIVLLAIVHGTLGCASKPVAPAHIIDTHIHLYDAARPQGVPWPPKEDADLFSPHLPADFHKVAKANGVTAAVIVEASAWIEDNQWLLDVTKNDPLFIAIVGNLQPGSEGFAANLDRFAADKRFVGIRPRGPQSGDVTNARYLADLALLAEKNLTLDFLAHSPPLADIIVIAEKLPKVRIIVNHLAGAKIDGKAPDPAWVAQVKTLAAHKNVYCKISGLSQQSILKPAPMDLSFYRPTLDVLFAAFGEDRVIFASNWPVTKKGGDYAGELQMTREFFAAKGQGATDKVFWLNASKFYGLGLK